MKSNGFELRKENGQIILDFILPESLRSLFHVSLYGRGPCFDASLGKPSVIWESMDPQKKLHRALVAPYQKHGVTVVDALQAEAMPFRQDGDGVYIDEISDACASLRFADCAPVVIAHAGEKPWMLVLHSGFVGTVKNISGTAIAGALARNPGSDLKKVYAWIAPAICAECYERELNEPNSQRGMESFSPENFTKRGEHVYFDIKNEIKRCITECGVLPEKISISEFCTCCDIDKFYSYRGGDVDNRNFLLAANTTKWVC